MKRKRKKTQRYFFCITDRFFVSFLVVNIFATTFNYWWTGGGGGVFLCNCKMYCYYLLLILIIIYYELCWGGRRSRGYTLHKTLINLYWKGKIYTSWRRKFLTDQSTSLGGGPGDTFHFSLLYLIVSVNCFSFHFSNKRPLVIFNLVWNARTRRLLRFHR